MFAFQFCHFLNLLAFLDFSSRLIRLWIGCGRNADALSSITSGHKLVDHCDVELCSVV